jgi:hypothetical protein
LERAATSTAAWINFVTNDIDFGIIRKDYTEEFYKQYNQGFEFYRKGDWQKATDHFSVANVNFS